MMLAVMALVMVGFPWLGAVVWRTSGTRGLSRAVLVVVACVVIAALVLSAPWAGNRLANDLGYGTIVRRALMQFSLTFLAPSLASAGVIVTVRMRLSQRAVAAVSVGIAFATMMLGVIAASYLA
jgi:hypothetical protein